MSSALTIAALRQQVKPVSVKYQCKLIPFAEAQLARLDKIAICYNENPMILDWIALHHDNYYDTEYIQWAFSQNPSGIPYLEANPEKIILGIVCANPKLSIYILHYILETFTPDLLDYGVLSGNPSDAVVDYMIANPSRIVWNTFSGNSNPKAVAQLQQHCCKINWSYLSGNESDAAVKLLKKYQNRIDFDALSLNSNPMAVKLLSLYPEHINCNRLSGNSNPAAVKLLMQQHKPELISWYALSKNPAAMDILKANPDKINFISFWRNPAIFEMDLREMNEGRWTIEFKELLLQVALHPDRISRLCREGFSFFEEIAAHL